MAGLNAPHAGTQCWPLVVDRGWGNPYVLGMTESAHAVQVSSPTELRNQRTLDIDMLATTELVQRINAEDQLVAPAVAAVLPAVAEMVEMGVAVLRGGGRIHYFGAGTSGRLAFADAAEVPPTFGVPEDWIVSHRADDAKAADGAAAISEGAEDATTAGTAAAAQLTSKDLAVGITASGRTPFVAAALQAARQRGARSVLVSSNPRAPLAAEADIHVAVDTGPEAIAGSTRLKAGTAAKLVLNTFSTAVMVQLGRTYSNLMIDVLPANAKLRGRQVRMLAEATGFPEDRCAAALSDADGRPSVALVCLLADVSPQQASAVLARHHGMARPALAELTGSRG